MTRIAPLHRTDPDRLGRYRLKARLGEGGMGTVYLAEDPAGRAVAVKVVRPEYARDEHFRGRFRSEVNRARAVPPFCTAAVLDAGLEHDPPYLVVEYVDGPSLGAVIADDGPLRAGSLHSLAVGIATALAAIHGAGVVHRDLKPQNVLLALGMPKVIDFGIAKATEPTSQHTRTSEMVGTLAYMAPERFDPETDRHPTPAADIFAWGAVITYAGTGRTPFAGDTPSVTAARILTQRPRLDGLPPDLVPVIERALAKDPRERPTAQELLGLLMSGGRGGDIQADVLEAAEAAQQVPGRRSRTSRLITAITAVAALAGGLLAYVTAPPTTPATAAFVNGEPEVVDALRGEGHWVVSGHAWNTCRFDDGLRVRTRAAYRCIGPRAAFPADLSVQVEAEMAARSCASVWFRMVAGDGYRADVCQQEVRLSTIVAGEAVGGTGASLPRAQGQRLLALTVRDGTAALAVDGRTVLKKPLTGGGGRGTVTFGALAQDPSGRTGAEVTFRDARITAIR
jgi:hypothetical protein